MTPVFCECKHNVLRRTRMLCALNFLPSLFLFLSLSLSMGVRCCSAPQQSYVWLLTLIQLSIRVEIIAEFPLSHYVVNTAVCFAQTTIPKTKAFGSLLDLPKEGLRFCCSAFKAAQRMSEDLYVLLVNFFCQPTPLISETIHGHSVKSILMVESS